MDFSRNISENIYALKLGQEFYDHTCHISWIRVPGGWLVTIGYEDEEPNRTTFVPFNNEFQLSE